MVTWELSDSPEVFLEVDVFQNTTMEFEATRTFYHWFTILVLVLGIILNFAGLLRLTTSRRKYIFVPYLLGLVIGNLIFLSFLTSYFTCQSYSLNCVGCEYVVFGMGSMSHVGTICLTAIAVERYVVIFCRRSFSFHHRFGRRRVKKERHQYFVLVLVYLYCLSSYSWTFFAAHSEPQDGILNTTVCLIQNSVFGEKTSNALMIISIVLTYFLPFFIAASVNFTLLCRLIHSSTPQNFSTMVTRTVARPTGTGTDSIVSLSPNSPTLAKTSTLSRGQLSLASVCISETLFARKERTKRNLLLIFTIGMTLDLLMNFPNRFINVAERTSPEIMNSKARRDLDKAGYILWHMQFCISPLFIWLPLFERRRKLSVHHQIVDAGRVALEVDDN